MFFTIAVEFVSLLHNSCHMIDIDSLLFKVGGNLRNIRSYHETSLSKLGEKLGFSHATLSKIESGKHRSVSLATIAEFCNLYGISLEEVLSLSGPHPIAFAKDSNGFNDNVIGGHAGLLCADGYLRALEMAYDEINLLKEILASRGFLQTDKDQK